MTDLTLYGTAETLAAFEGAGRILRRLYAAEERLMCASWLHFAALAGYVLQDTEQTVSARQCDTRDTLATARDLWEQATA